MAEPWNIAAGELRQVVTVQVKSASSNDTRGHPSRSWSDAVANVAANISTPVGKKMEYARQLVPDATHQVTIRYRVLDTDNNRLTYFGIRDTALTGAANTTATTLTVGSAATIRVNSVLLIDSEQVQVTAANGTSLTVTRAFNSTTAANHANASTVRVRKVYGIGHIEDVAERHVKLVLTCSELKDALQ